MPKNNWKKELRKTFGSLISEKGRELVRCTEGVEMFISKTLAQQEEVFNQEFISGLKKQRTQLIQEFKEIVGENLPITKIETHTGIIVANNKRNIIINQTKQEIRDKLKEKYETKEK